jgi:predicted GNAT superfamily acetyltransferase
MDGHWPVTARHEPADAAPVVLRPLHTPEDYRQCLALQDRTWGERFAERVPTGVLRGAQKVGGVAAGAFDASQALLGFVFGFNGVRDGRLAHWSYMLAVREDAQGRGLGRRLKTFQRSILRASGIEVAYWTYDPLVSANAHLNLSRLGARPIEYVIDQYGEDTGSDVHRGLGTDRFLVEWRLSDPQIEEALTRGLVVDDGPLATAPTVTPTAENRSPERALPSAHTVLVEIPEDIFEVRARSADEAWQWRSLTRRAFRHYLARGYVVTGWHRRPPGRHSAYVLTAPPDVDVPEGPSGRALDMPSRAD